MLFSKSFKVFGQSIKGEIHDAKASTGEKISQSLDNMERKVMRGIYHTVDGISDMKKNFNEGRAKYFTDDESNSDEIIKMVIDEPEKIVVPKFVEEWIEASKVVKE